MLDIDEMIAISCPICGNKQSIASMKNGKPFTDELICETCYNRYALPALQEQKEVEQSRPSWKTTFFEVAKIIAKRSKDPHTKVGAVLVKNNRIIGVGYNGEPKGFKLSFDWNSSKKYDYVIHAELNAIANASSIGANVKDADIYLTMSPCHECIKLLIQHEIHAVYYINDYKDIELTKQIAENANIILKKENENENY